MSLQDALCVTDLPLTLFADECHRQLVEDIFQQFGTADRFVWLSSFRRLIIIYQDCSMVSHVRNCFADIGGFPLPDSDNVAKLFRIQIPSIDTDTSDSQLHPPENDRMFLISPPASPPFGWQQIAEQPPVISLHSPLQSDSDMSDSEEQHHQISDLHGLIRRQLPGDSQVKIARGGSVNSLTDMMEYNSSISGSTDSPKPHSSDISNHLAAVETEKDHQNIPEIPRIVINDWDRLQRKLAPNTGESRSENDNNENILSHMPRRTIPKTRMPLI